MPYDSRARPVRRSGSIVADIKTFSRFGCFATAAVSSVTFQNTTGVFGAEHQTAESVRKQIEAVVDDYDVAAVKTGMLPTREVIETVADIIAERKLKNVVVDPVVRSTSGYDLIDDAALTALIEKLFSRYGDNPNPPRGGKDRPVLYPQPRKHWSRRNVDPRKRCCGGPHEGRPYF